MEERLTINGVAKLCGITVRALHYYDEIGLLCPSTTAPNGYRLYNNDDLLKLQEILFFKELDFPLKEIKQIMNNPYYSKKEAFLKHKELLTLKRDRLNDIINLINDNLTEERLSLKEFDMTKIKEHMEKYAEETKQRWGDTDAYKQSSKRTAKYTDEDWKKINKEQDEIFDGFASCMKKESGSKSADELVSSWQEHITKYYYDCTDEILLGLAAMYEYDEKFKENMDKHGEGITEFISQSIRNYCKNK